MQPTRCCDICGNSVPLQPVFRQGGGRHTGAVLCGSVHCVLRHRTMPAPLKCVVCEKPLSRSRLAYRFCDAEDCRLEVRRRRPEHEEELAVQAAFSRSPEHRRRSAASRGMPPELAATYPPALIPVNTARISRLPDERRRTFELHLRTELIDARRQLEEAGAIIPVVYESTIQVRDDRPAAERDAMNALLVAGCTMCRGRCCMKGKEHAFHSSGTLLKYLERHPDDDIDEIVARFMDDIGERTMTNGCIFQGEHGCTLDGERRSPTCHQYFCPGLMTVQNQHEPGEPVRAYFVQIRKGRIAETEFVHIDMAVEQ